MEKLRINKFLSQKGIGSRREIDRMIEEKRVSVNGEIAEAGIKVNEKDIIKLDGKIIEIAKERLRYFLLNKPLGYVCASKDKFSHVVVELIDCAERIYPIGRLDKDTTGALLLTNDGELFNKLIHPSFKMFKKYLATVKGIPDEKKIKDLKNGVQLDDGLTLPAKVQYLEQIGSNSVIEISIREGKNRQIRRMFKAIGHPVVKLHRLAIGDLNLGNIKLGKYSELKYAEIKKIMGL